MAHPESQLAANDLVLGDKILDRIDAITPPGRNMTDRDAGYTPPALTDAAARRIPRSRGIATLCLILFPDHLRHLSPRLP